MSILSKTVIFICMSGLKMQKHIKITLIFSLLKVLKSS